MKTFEQYLMNDVWEPEGVLDDDMPDAFDAWCAELDVQEVMDLAEIHGEKMYMQGKEDVLKGLEPHIEKLAEGLHD